MISVGTLCCIILSHICLEKLAPLSVKQTVKESADSSKSCKIYKFEARNLADVVSLW